MARNYVALPYEYLDEMALLNDEEFGRLVRGLLLYGSTGALPELPGNERFLFQRAKAQEDRFQASYEDLTAKRREAGRKGARRRWQTDDSDGKPMAADDNGGNTETKTKIKTNTKTETKTKIKTDTETRPPDGGTPGAAGKEGRAMPPEPRVQWADNVAMTNGEYERLLAAYGPADTRRLIELLDNYKGSTGKTYASDYRAILSWCVERLAEEKRRASQSGSPRGQPGSQSVSYAALADRLDREEGL